MHAVADYLLGQDPGQIERTRARCAATSARQRSGAEMRAASGDRHRALGSLRPGGRAAAPPSCSAARAATRSAPTTPAPGTATSATSSGQAVMNWGLPGGDAEGPYEDLDAFLNRADELARDLLAQGITGDEDLAVRPVRRGEPRARHPTADLDRALEPFRKIRAAVGPAIDVMVELHALWDVPAACRIARALDEFEPALDRGSGPRHERGRARRGPARNARRRSPSARRSPGSPRSATCSRAAARRSSSSTSAGSAASRRRARSPRSPRRSSGRSRRTTARARSSTPRRRTSRCTCRTR